MINFYCRILRKIRKILFKFLENGVYFSDERSRIVVNKREEIRN